MSAQTSPAAPQTPNTASPAGPSDNDQEKASLDRFLVEHLQSRGYTDAANSLSKALEDRPGDEEPQDLPIKDFIRALAIRLRPTPKEPAPMMTESDVQTLLANLVPADSKDLLSMDPTGKQDGFRELEAWVEGSLDMYRPEFRPILFPIFSHFYLDLVEQGYKDAALRFFALFSPSLLHIHSESLHHLSTLLLPAHVQNDELAQRFREEKYVIKMSRSGFGLLVGWLTEGVGGEALGSGDGFRGEQGKRGRAAVMRVVNNHLRFDVTSSNPTAIPANSWEETSGLLSSLAGKSNGLPSTTQLKLGRVPLSDELKQEVQHTIRQQDTIDGTMGQLDLLPSAPGLIAPSESDLPPLPPTFKRVDLEREVSAVRDARKRIRLEPTALHNVDMNSPLANAARARALPSICAYTLHDVPEGAPSSTFSLDTSLLAAGFAESYIKIWSLKGEKLRGMRSDFASNTIRDSSSIRKIKEKKGSTVRKLIGHSGPVYSVAFDPVSGSAAPPRHLLSSSADGTARLWSLDTFTNLVAYRGHENPVWDVKWSPLGVYFATASRDRTARLWSTDRLPCLRLYAGHLSDVDCLEFHPNGVYLATGSSDWTARLWDVQRAQSVRVFIGHRGAVTSMAISPDGRYLASAGEDLAINLWDLGSGKRVKKMTGHTSSIYSLAFSAESSVLVSGGADWTVRCWDVKSAGGAAGKARDNGAADYTPLGLATQENAAVRGGTEEESFETNDLISTFPTKRTPITNVQFTSRNLCLVSGNYIPQESR